MSPSENESRANSAKNINSETQSTRNDKERADKNGPSSKGLKHVQIKGDGDCLFRAVAQCLQRVDEDKLVHYLRQRAVDEMSKHAKKYKNFFVNFNESEFMSDCNEYRKSGKYDGYFGDVLPLALSTTLNIPIKVLNGEDITPLESSVNHEVVIENLVHNYELKHYDRGKNMIVIVNMMTDTICA